MSKKEVTVKAKYLRISPKKAIPYARKFKGKALEKAYELIQSIDNKFSSQVKKLLDSGVSAAKEQELDEDKLVIHLTLE